MLGPPDQVNERQIGREQGTEPNAIVWLYEGARVGRLQLLFMDRTGLGRYELSPQSENEFRHAAQRLRPRTSN